MDRSADVCAVDTSPTNVVAALRQSHLLTTGQAARILDLSVEMVRVLVRRGVLPAITVGRNHRLLDRRDVERVRDARKAERAARRGAHVPDGLVTTP